MRRLRASMQGDADIELLCHLLDGMSDQEIFDFTLSMC